MKFQPETLIPKFGELKRVRYLVNSTSDFVEIVKTVTEIVGRAGDIFVVESLQKIIKFNVIPLPDSSSKFIAMFDVPSGLLGEDRDKNSIELNFDNYLPECSEAEVLKHSAVHLYNYKVDSLFDVNLALFHFESSVASELTDPQLSKLSSTTKIQVTPRTAEDQQLDFLISAEKNLSPAL